MEIRLHPTSWDIVRQAPAALCNLKRPVCIQREKQCMCDERLYKGSRVNRDSKAIERRNARFIRFTAFVVMICMLSGCDVASGLKSASTEDKTKDDTTHENPVVTIFKNFGDRALSDLQKDADAERRFREQLDKKLLNKEITEDEYLRIQSIRNKAAQQELESGMEALINLQKKQLELVEKTKRESE